MKIGKALIATASWEDRYNLGVRASVEKRGVDHVVILSSLRYESDTKAETDRLRVFCDESGVGFEARCFDFEDQVKVLRSVEDVTNSLRDFGDIIFDISTTPRPVIWTVLDALARSYENVAIRYYPGEKYGDWQTNEEGEPRLVLRRSGIMYPDQPTSLILLCGPEISRAEKMCFQFEPKSVYVLRDPRAAQFGTVRHLPQEYRSVAREVEFDNMDLSDENFCKLDELAGQLLAPASPNNVVAAALGPKLGALLLFRLSRRRPEVGLGYVISGKHNRVATTGLGSRTDFDLRLKAFGD